MNPGLRYLHWPGFINRTHPFGLAVYCVFIKQSGPPRYCNLLSQFHIKKAGTTSSYRTWLFCRVPLPTVPRYALGFSPRITSVGSRYDLMHPSLILLCFHCLLESSKRPQRAAILFSRKFSSLRLSLSLNRLNRAINSANRIRKRQKRYRPLRDIGMHEAAEY